MSNSGLDWTGKRVRCTSPSQFPMHNYLAVGHVGTVEIDNGNGHIIIEGDPDRMSSTKRRFVLVEYDELENFFQ